MLKIGIIGMGVISQYYVTGFTKHDDIALCAVCDLNDDRMSDQKAQGIDCYNDYHEMLKRPDLDGVIINLPNNLHFKTCMDALRAGKHVCCEKPLCLELDEAQKLEQTARALQLTMLTCFHRRYNRHLLAAIDDGSLRDAVAYIAHYDERIEDHAGRDSWYLNPLACGGGCIADNGPNIFDTLSFTLGPLQFVDIKARFDARGLDVGAEINLRTLDCKPIVALLSWDYAHGETKNLIAVKEDGSSVIVDMLKDSQEFKGSLHHEYDGALRHFHDVIQSGGEFGSDGVSAVKLVNECYEALKHQAGQTTKNILNTRLIKTLHHSRTERGMQVMEYASRCVRAGDIHELVTTDHDDLKSGSTVDRVGFIGFIEAQSAGVIEVGDAVFVGETSIGSVTGFDDCHFPNHYNVLVKSDKLLNADDLPSAVPGRTVSFQDASRATSKSNAQTSKRNLRRH